MQVKLPEARFIHVEKPGVVTGQKTLLNNRCPPVRINNALAGDATNTAQRVPGCEDRIDRKAGATKKRRHMHVAVPECVKGQKKTPGSLGIQVKKFYPITILETNTL